MELMHNQVINITIGDYVGIHRIILDLIGENITILVRIDHPNEVTTKRKGRPKSNPAKFKKNQNIRLLTELVWAKRDELQDLYNSKLIQQIEIEPEVILLKEINNIKQKNIFAERVKTMQGFLDLDNLKHRIIYDKNLGGLIGEATRSSGASKTQVYKLFSLLCQHGFTETSLRPRFYRCGSPGKERPCDPGGRKKPGKKTLSEKIDMATTGQSTPTQPGISSAWKSLILAADSGIKNPKPLMPTRCKLIINSAFIKKIKNIDGKLIPIHPELGQYPNIQQIQRVLKKHYSSIEWVKHKTTSFHFTANKRGLTGRNWEGVSGPGHTWAIDSTVGDIYLRSSVNRNWIVGRPIVYVIVDVWSTAIVGFYVCLSGPSWDMAKISLFCAAMNPNLIAEMYGYQPMFILDPYPTFPSILMCDRGEYLSLGASYTSLKLIPTMSYAPPYRGDLKGLAEVMHRIEKDQQFYFVPGAIDARRKEYELRKFDPRKAALTVREYTQYLHTVFAEYNLTANRDHRLDSHMRATDVTATPAGLWSWGHKVGIGVQRAKSEAELITTLLPDANATLSREGIKFGGNHYISTTGQDREWAEIARNFGSSTVQGHYFPGSVSNIWIPNNSNRGMLKLQLSDYSTASPELTFDEYADSLAYSKLQNQQLAHERIIQKYKFHAKREVIIRDSKNRTAEASNQFSSSQPPIKFTRAIEEKDPNNFTLNNNNTPNSPLLISQDHTGNITKIMRELLDSHNRKDDLNE